MKLFFAVSLAVIVGLLPTRLNAADISDIQFSTWDTTYADDQGTFSVHSIVTFNGQSGTYDLDTGDRGTFTGLRYAYITPAPELKVGVYGTWHLGGDSGGFTFRVSGDGQSFLGQWRQGARSGTWSGTRR